MSIKKTLTSIVLAGALTLGSGCSNKYSNYNFNGKIGDEEVNFYQEIGPNNVLKIVKGNKKIYYVDSNNDDLKLERVTIYEVDNDSFIGAYNLVKSYSLEDESEKPVVEEAQIQFNNYLVKILAIKEQRKLDKLKAEEQEKLKKIQEGIKNLQ